MARIKIAMPGYFSFTTTVDVRITDINYGGHVGNDTLMSIIHEARMRFLNHSGYSELDCGGAGLIMSDAAIEFKNEIFYGDQLKVAVTAAEFTKVAFDIFYQLEKSGVSGPVLIANAKTGMVCFDYHQRKICPVPEIVKQKLSA